MTADDFRMAAVLLIAAALLAYLSVLAARDKRARAFDRRVDTLPTTVRPEHDTTLRAIMREEL